jgi:acyl phosphate:glycerol-3-phosphate acyltransferase
LVLELAIIPLGYVIGSLPFGYWLPRLLSGVDIRTVGSGSTGATNVWRSVGFKIGLGVALLDIGKGLAAALLGRWVGGDLIGVLTGCAAVVGHWRPLFMRFGRGGKMVATTAGVGLGLATYATLAVVPLWIAVFLLTRYASVASLACAAALPLFAFLFGASTPVVAFLVGAGIAIALLHLANIRRLLNGTENRFDLHLTRRFSRRREASL